jgi:hypothetical protein
MVNDFFSDVGGLVDQDTGVDVLPETNPNDPPQQNNQNQLPNQNNGINPKSNDGQGTTNQQPQNNAQQQPQTFDQQFFKTDDKGNSTFDADKALGFMMPQNNSSFQYQGIAAPVQTQPQMQNPQTSAQQEPIKAPWQIELEEEDRIRTESKSKHITWRNYLQEAMEAGYSGDNAIAFADRKADEAADADFRKSFYEFKSKKAEESAKTAQEETELKSIEPRSQINLTKTYNELGGVDKFNALVFGVPSPDGKSLSGGFGVDILNREFDRDHRGQKLPSDPAQLQTMYEKWYKKFTSNENDLRYLVDVSKSRLQMAMFPQIVNHLRSLNDAGNSQMSQAKQKAPSGINKQQGSQPDALDQYFGRAGGGSYDTV